MPTENRSTDPRDLFISLNPLGLTEGDLRKDTTGFADERTHADYLTFLAGFNAANPAEQHLGEPVAFRAIWPDGDACCWQPYHLEAHRAEEQNVASGMFKSIELAYAHPDSGEVERLREKITQLRSALSGTQERWATLETALLAQLAERDALLADASALARFTLPEAWHARYAALSPSQEPN